MILYLPGFSPKNRAEMNSITEFLTARDLEVLTHSWRHWDDQTIPFDIETEVQRILEMLAQHEIRTLQLVAKSIGTYISTILLDRLSSHIQVAQIVLLGIPYADLNEQERQSMHSVLLNSHINIGMIHNENDYHGSAMQVREMLDSINYTEIIKAEVSHHDYSYPAEVYSFLQDK